MGRSVLVTGGAGFIGSNFIRGLLAADPDVRILTLDALTYAGTRDNLAGLPDPRRHRFARGDIADRVRVGRLLRRHRIDTIVHFAAETHVDRSLKDPAPFFRTNVMGTLALLEEACSFWIDRGPFPEGPVRFHHISTDEVFGPLGPEDPPAAEDSPYRPSSPYAASKAAADHLVRAYRVSRGLPATLTYCTNNYGPFQFPEKLVALTIANALEEKPIPVYGDGLQIRDWLYVADHCDAVRAVLERGAAGEAYAIGGGERPTNLDLVRRICALLDEYRPRAGRVSYESLVRRTTDRPGHDRRYALDPAKIRDALGWSPRESLDSGLRKTVRWYLDHPGWLRARLRRPAHRRWIAEQYGTMGEAE
jgi:dTDP-glucose 4,6-dehydratase